MPFETLDADALLYISGLLVAYGVAVAVWMLVVEGRSRGRKRCRGCWYSMEGAAAGEGGGYRCPECGREMRRERDLYRTRRHWRPAAVGVVLLLAGVSLAGTVFLRHKNLWRYAPDIVLINEIPRMRNTGLLTYEFGRRDFVEGFEARTRVAFGPGGMAVHTEAPKKWRVRKLNGLERRLLAHRAAEALEEKAACPFRSELLVLLALSGHEKERAFKIASDAVASGSDIADVAVSVLPLVAPDRATAAAIVTKELAAVMQADPRLGNWDHRWRAAALVEAIGDLGADGVGAVPVLISMLPFDNADEREGWGGSIPVIEALGRIGPGASAALPYLASVDSLTRAEPWAGDRVDGPAARLLIEGKCRTEEAAFVLILKSPNWRARRAAATSLGSVADITELGREALRGALKDPDHTVREAAGESLRQLERGFAARVRG